MWKIIVIGLLALCGAPALAAGPARPLIAQPVDEMVLVPLSGNVRPEANAANDRGAVEDTLPLDHLMLQLRRPPEREAALDQMIDALHDPSSPHYHQWLSPTDIDADYGLAGADLRALAAWLERHGFRVNFIYSNGMVIDFTGTAGQVRAAFHTELHRLEVNGEPHMANFGEPQVPAALAPAIVGILPLNDFRPRHQSTYTGCVANLPGVGCEAVVPADLATIYNLNPLFAAGITGEGQRIAVVDDSDADNMADWATFRKKYGLSGYASGSVSLAHPQPKGGAANCFDPGVNADNVESILDTEWASAAAPNAQIILASCGSSVSVDGLLTAIINLTEESAAVRPQIISLSFGECESLFGASNAAYNSAYQTAVAGGISVFVSAGDQLSAACDVGEPPTASSGIAVNGLASTPYNVAVGGTDFGDAFHGEVGAYWQRANSPVFGSARSYVPEISWNDSCASELIAQSLGFATTYGASGACNSFISSLNELNRVVGGGGGPSGCATGSRFARGAGGCAGYPRPSWQNGVSGLPNNDVRNLPDVSLFASAAPWGHSYVICATDLGGCVPGQGGTSFASPILAGVQALVNQQLKATSGEGNPNVAYYRLAAREYATATQRAACDATNGSAVASSCVFHDVTEGDIDAPCSGDDCFQPSGGVGVLSTSLTGFEPAFPATPGWDFATGLGSVNVTNLVLQWRSVEP